LVVSPLLTYPSHNTSLMMATKGVKSCKNRRFSAQIIYSHILCALVGFILILRHQSLVMTYLNYWIKCWTLFT